MVCGSSRPSMSSTIQYSSGSQLACHCRSRLPVRLLPSCTQFAPVAARWSLWHYLTKDRHTAAAVRFATTSPISGQPRVCAHSATFFALFRTHAPGNHHARAFLSPEEPVALFSLSRRGASQPRFVVLPPVAQRCCQLIPVSSISPYSGSANGQLIWTPPA